MGTHVEYKTWEHRELLRKQPLTVGTLQYADGTQEPIGYSYNVTEWLTTEDGSTYGTAFRLSRDGSDSNGTRRGVMPIAFDVVAVASDSRMRWSNGALYYEGAVEVREVGTGHIIGYGFTEAVGWDRSAIRSIVSTALRLDHPSDEVVDLLSSRPPRDKPPPR